MRGYFTKGEIALWSAAVLGIVGSFALFDGESYLTLTASLIGVTSLIFSAKGNPVGQALMVLFSLLYGFSLGGGWRAVRRQENKKGSSQKANTIKLRMSLRGKCSHRRGNPSPDALKNGFPRKKAALRAAFFARNDSFLDSFFLT